MASPKWPVIVLMAVMLSVTMCSAHRVKVKNLGSAMAEKKDDDGWVDHTDTPAINTGYGYGGGYGDGAGGGGGGGGWTSGGSSSSGGYGHGDGGRSGVPVSGGGYGYGHGGGSSGGGGGGGGGSSGSSGGGYGYGHGGDSGSSASGGGGWNGGSQPGSGGYGGGSGHGGGWGMPSVGEPYYCQPTSCPVSPHGACKGFTLYIDNANVKPNDNKEQLDGKGSPPSPVRDSSINGDLKPNDDKEKQDGDRLENEGSIGDATPKPPASLVENED